MKRAISPGDPMTISPRKAPARSHTVRVFYDCETSGYGCTKYKQDRILEIAGVVEGAEGTASSIQGLTRKVFGGPDILPSGYFSELVNGGACAPRVSAIHQITPEQTRGARPFEEVWGRFVSFVHEAQERTPKCKAVSLIGHNSFFSDNYWLLAELERCGRAVEELATGGRRLVFEDIYPKSEETKRRLKSALNITSLKNSDIHGLFFGGSSREVHHALWDAAATRDNWRDARVRASTTRISLEQQLGHWKVLAARNALEGMHSDHSDCSTEEGSG